MAVASIDNLSKTLATVVVYIYRLVDGLSKWKAKFPLEISVWGRLVPFGQQTQLTERAWDRRIERDFRCVSWRGITSRLWGIWKIPLNISHCSFHDEKSEEKCCFLWGCGAVLCNGWVQITLSNDENHLLSSCSRVGSYRFNPHSRDRAASVQVEVGGGLKKNA